MTIKTRLRTLERDATPNIADQPNCIFLCAMTKNSEGRSDPRVAILLRGKTGDEVSRLPNESAEIFKRRVDDLLNSPPENGKRQRQES